MKILFIGDSITDAGRNTERGSLESIGQGYVLMIGGRLGYESPQKYEIINRGISGDRIVDIYARIKKDCWNESPDVISIFAGVNDVIHEPALKNGVEAERFERVYRMLLEDTRAVLPKAKIIIVSPFIFECELADNTYLKKEVMIRAEIAERLGHEFGTQIVSLQDKFNEAANITGDSRYWVGDGVHPTSAGHWLIAEAWMEAFKKL